MRPAGCFGGVAEDSKRVVDLGKWLDGARHHVPDGMVVGVWDLVGVLPPGPRFPLLG